MRLETRCVWTCNSRFARSIVQRPASKRLAKMLPLGPNLFASRMIRLLPRQRPNLRSKTPRRNWPMPSHSSSMRKWIGRLPKQNSTVQKVASKVAHVSGIEHLRTCIKTLSSGNSRGPCNRARLQSCRKCRKINVGFSPCGAPSVHPSQSQDFFRSLFSHRGNVLSMLCIPSAAKAVPFQNCEFLDRF